MLTKNLVEITLRFPTRIKEKSGIIRIAAMIQWTDFSNVFHLFSNL
jgi:hypothetical protein